MYAIILAFITAFFLTYNVIPSVILIALKKKLFDQPNARSSHRIPTPSLGGIGIFAGVICGAILWTPTESFGYIQYILAAMLVVAFIGLKDDLIELSPTRKFLGQIFAALILVYKAEISITNLCGLFGIYALPELVSFVFSIVAIVGIINAFNLIDGINGLAGSIGLLACTCFGAWFFKNGYVEYALLAFSLAGGLVAFLKYNLTPARIFMGDTGSLLVGLISAVLAIKFIEVQQVDNGEHFAFNKTAPILAISIIILPLFDTMRVFTRRMLAGKSPFYPDKTHIHHLCLDAGLSHSQSTVLLITANIFIIAIVFLLRGLNATLLLFILIGLLLLLTQLLSMYAKRHKAKAAL